MSELKARRIGQLMSEAGRCDTEVYLKSEADKVIAEKDKTIAELKKACNDKDDWCLHTLKENHHQKYKRCLAMAKWCETQFAYYIASCDRYDSKYVNKKAGHFYKWKYKWLELAEKFKEAK